MGFGNPYGDAYSPQIVEHWVEKIAQLDIKTFMLSDTVGIADPTIIEYLFATLIPAFPKLDIGAHLHTAPHNWKVKIDAAFKNGCMRFDSVIKGYGGCPMAKDDLTGNLATENIISFLENQSVKSLQNKGISEINWPSLKKLYSVFEICNRVFSHA